MADQSPTTAVRVAGVLGVCLVLLVLGIWGPLRSGPRLVGDTRPKATSDERGTVFRDIPDCPEDVRANVQKENPDPQQPLKQLTASFPQTLAGGASQSELFNRQLGSVAGLVSRPVSSVKVKEVQYICWAPGFGAFVGRADGKGSLWPGFRAEYRDGRLQIVELQRPYEVVIGSETVQVLWEKPPPLPRGLRYGDAGEK